MKKLRKGSKEAKEFMAKLRRMRGKSKVGATKKVVQKRVVRKRQSPCEKAYDKCQHNSEIDNYKWFVVNTLTGKIVDYSETKNDANWDKKWRNEDLIEKRKEPIFEVWSLDQVKRNGEFNQIEKMYISGLERVNRRRTTTYVHYTREKPIKKAPKKTARKSSARRVEKRTTIALSSLNHGDTFTMGTSSKIYERLNKVPNQNKYVVVDLAGKTYQYSGTKRVYLEGEYGVSGFVHKKTHGRKTTLKYTHPVSKKVSGVSTPSKAHTDYNSPEVNIQIGMVHDNMSMISKHMHSIAMLNEKIAQIKELKRLQEPMEKRSSDKQIAYLKKNIASYKKQISELKKHI